MTSSEKFSNVSSSFSEWPSDRDVYESAFAWLDEMKVEMVFLEDVQNDYFQKNRQMVLEAIESQNSLAKQAPAEETKSCSLKSSSPSARLKMKLSIRTSFAPLSLQKIQTREELEETNYSQSETQSAEKLQSSNMSQSDRAISLHQCDVSSPQQCSARLIRLH